MIDARDVILDALCPGGHREGGGCNSGASYTKPATHCRLHRLQADAVFAALQNSGHRIVHWTDRGKVTPEFIWEGPDND